MDVETHWRVRDGRFRDKWVIKTSLKSSPLRRLFVTPNLVLFLARFGCFLKSGFSQKTWHIIAKMNMFLSSGPSTYSPFPRSTLTGRLGAGVGA